MVCAKLLEKTFNIYMLNDITIEKACLLGGVSRTTFCRFLKKKTLEKKKWKNKKTYKPRWKRFIKKEILDKALDIYLSNNFSAKKVGEMFGMSSRPILSYARELGKEKNRQDTLKRKIPLEKHKEVIEEYIATKDCAKIAKKYNVDYNVIKGLLKKNGIKFFTRAEKTGVTEEIKAQIIKDYISLMPKATIRNKYNLTNNQIDSCVSNCSRKRVSKATEISEIDKKNIVKLYCDGEILVKNIQKKYNISNSVLKVILQEFGIKRKYRSCLDFLSEKEKQEICEMYNKNCHIQEIIDKYKVSRTGIKNLLTERGEWESRKGLRSINNTSDTSRGISGIYKGTHFRSLVELCFISQVLMKKYKDSEWRSGENKNDRIRYISPEGIEKWYYPDFIIKNKIIIECKPKKFWKDPIFLKKNDASKRYCKSNGKKFVVIDPKVDLEFVAKLYQDNQLTLTEKQELRLKNKISKYIIK